MEAAREAEAALEAEAAPETAPEAVPGGPTRAKFAMRAEVTPSAVAACKRARAAKLRALAPEPGMYLACV